MDGVLLVFDSRTLPNLHALAPIDPPLATTRPHWRHRTFPAVAALILASVLSLVYFVSTQRPVPSSVPVSGASITAPPLNPSDSSPMQPPLATEANSTAVVTETPNEAEAKPEITNKAAGTTPPAPAPAKKASAKPSATPQSKPADEPKKDDSKVGSILKKTGRILKKPFKF
jgi:hypothetical protein